ncbi:hypothetical protein BdWA1_002043 [Babesia duncani]|uniref:Uncharacterized protein n=1 Tax=Babesia duncani TaxID=323732 RepID=A0AAD9UPE5_9APIC|nr:hypothetical protein BdWA1_003524 [Babesia duncani]KAK2196794.1 hypothetical protein BdWA1_002043 [Babesia duncani]
MTTLKGMVYPIGLFLVLLFDQSCAYGTRQSSLHAVRHRSNAPPKEPVPSKTHEATISAVPDNASSIAQQPPAPTPAPAVAPELEHVPPAPSESINVILSPTASRVSEEVSSLLHQMERGLQELRGVLSSASKLEQLLSPEDKNATFTLEGEDYSISLLLSGLEKLVADGEKQERLLIKGTSEILSKLVAPNPNKSAT